MIAEHVFLNASTKERMSVPTGVTFEVVRTEVQSMGADEESGEPVFRFTHFVRKIRGGIRL